VGIIMVSTTVVFTGSETGEKLDPNDPANMITEKVSTPGDTLGVLPFFFQIPHISTAVTSPGN
jgi:hypothetical protein